MTNDKPLPRAEKTNRRNSLLAFVLGVLAVCFLINSLVWIEVSLGKFTGAEKTMLPIIASAVLVAMLELVCWKLLFSIFFGTQTTARGLAQVASILLIQLTLFGYWAITSGTSLGSMFVEWGVSQFSCAISALLALMFFRILLNRNRSEAGN